LYHPINDADPRDVLNHIKRFQPNLAAGMDLRHGNQFYGGYQDQALPRIQSFQGSQFSQYGLPLQYPIDEPKQSFPYSDGDLLRQSFAR
jgi:hypothetical protein